MKNLGVNRMFGAVVGALLMFLMFTAFSSSIYEVKTPRTAGYAVDVPEPEAEVTLTEAAAEPEPEAAEEAPTETETAETETAETETAETETAETETAEAAAADEAETEMAAAEPEAPAEAAPEPEREAVAEGDAAEESTEEMVAEAPAEADDAAAGGGEPGVLMAGLDPDFATLLASTDPDDGKKVFRKCQACHRLNEGQHAVGPSLHGVIGRPVGSADGFSYSDAMGGFGGQWTYAELNAYLTNPREHMPGNKMSFAGLKKDEERAAVIAYLNEADGSPEPLPAP